MPPFTPPQVLLSGLKDKFDSLAVLADRLYLGTSTGNLHIYTLKDEETNAPELVEVKKGLARRSIEQLGFIKDVNSLVVLSEGTVTLYPLPSLSPPTPLLKAKVAFSFAVISYVKIPKAAASADELEFKRSQPIPQLVTLLLVGCRRKAVLYTWKDGEPQEVKEAPLPHSARSITFVDADSACFAYSPTEYAMFNLRTMTAAEIVTPLPLTGSGTAMTALTGLTGYMTLGLGAKAKPAVVKISEKEVLIAKDGQGFFVGPDGKLSRSVPIEWPAPPEEISFIKPYIFSVLPLGTVQTQLVDAPPTTASFIPTSVLQIQSSLSSQVMQRLPFPFNATSDPTASQNASLRLMTPSNSNKSPLYLISTPTDKVTLANEGSTVWCVNLRPWTEQLDELVLAEKYLDALALLDTLDDSTLLDKDQRRTRIRALNAVADFRSSRFDQAIDAFIELDFNPAKVVALYPDSVAGRLSVPRDEWIPLYGGPAGGDDRASSHDQDRDRDSTNGAHARSPTDLFDQMASGTGSVGGRLRNAGMAIFAGASGNTASRDDDTASIIARQHGPHGNLNQSIETLLRYLSDRRPKLDAALKAIGITPASQSHLTAPLSEATVEELFTLPNEALSALTPEQLVRFAQIVDTALYKSYLIVRPALLGSLCRVPNWCEVTEVEEDLKARKKYAELRDLYKSKKMHDKALNLLKDLSEDVDDMEDKLSPSIEYLQKLGPEYTETVFKGSRWIFDADSDMAFEIFTSEDVELPRGAVADYLEDIDPTLCIRYLEFLITERQEESTAFHDRLAELYLRTTVSARKRGDEKVSEEIHRKLLEFVNTDDKFNIDRLYRRVSQTDLHEARAILLGRMGLHDQALEAYVYRIQDFKKAEEYCKRVYKTGSDTSNVFLTLLRIYLRPKEDISTNLLQPALDLISRHSPRLDSIETLQLLPPLVTTQDIHAFLIEGLRVPIFDTHVVRQISKSRNDQLARRLMSLQSRRVKVTDSRICPQCHKRLGNSVIAVHAPRGEVTHYQCREPFSRRLHELHR